MVSIQREKMAHIYRILYNVIYLFIFFMYELIHTLQERPFLVLSY